MKITVRKETIEDYELCITDAPESTMKFMQLHRTSFDGFWRLKTYDEDDYLNAVDLLHLVRKIFEDFEEIKVLKIFPDGVWDAHESLTLERSEKNQIEDYVGPLLQALNVQAYYFLSFEELEERK